MNKKGKLSVVKHPDGSEEITFQDLIMPPEMLMGYKQVDPKLPDIILKLNIDEIIHRRDCEKRFLRHIFVLVLSTYLCSLIVSGAILLTSFYYMSGGFAPGRNVDSA